jgi:hypothetical protein
MPRNEWSRSSYCALWDTYSFCGFRSEPTVRGIFGDPKARVIKLNRRSKKQRVGAAVAFRWAGLACSSALVLPASAPPSFEHALLRSLGPVCSRTASPLRCSSSSPIARRLPGRKGGHYLRRHLGRLRRRGGALSAQGPDYEEVEQERRIGAVHKAAGIARKYATMATTRSGRSSSRRPRNGSRPPPRRPQFGEMRLHGGVTALCV